MIDRRHNDPPGTVDDDPRSEPWLHTSFSKDLYLYEMRLKEFEAPLQDTINEFSSRRWAKTARRVSLYGLKVRIDAERRHRARELAVSPPRKTHAIAKRILAPGVEPKAPASPRRNWPMTKVNRAYAHVARAAQGTRQSPRI